MLDMRKFPRVSAATKYPFGISGPDTADALRDLADRFDRGELLPQGANLLWDVQLDDFQMVTFILQFAPKKDQPMTAEQFKAAVLALLQEAA